MGSSSANSMKKCFRNCFQQNPNFLFVRHSSTIEIRKPSPVIPAIANSNVDSVVQLIHGTDWSKVVEKDLRNLIVSLTPSQLLITIKKLADSRKAFDFFEWGRNQEFLQIHGPSAYQSLFELASKEPQPHQRMKEFLEKSREQGFFLTNDSASLVISCFGRAGMIQESLQVLKEVRSRTRIRKPFVYNHMLNALVKSDLVNEAIELVHDMIISDCVVPNYVTFSIVFSALMKKNRFCDAFDLVVKMGEHGVFPDAIHLTQFITKLCKSSDTERAWEVLRTVRDMGGTVVVSSCNALLTRLGMDCDFERMNLLMGEMKQMGIEPNVITFGILINHLCKSRRVDEALLVLEKMMNGEGTVAVPMDVITFNTVVDGLCKVGRQGEALSLMGRMKQHGCCPNTVTYNSLIDCFCKVGAIQRAEHLFARMMDEGIPPDVITFNTIIDGMCKHGRVSGALEFLRNIQAKGFKCNAITYNTLIDSFCSVNNTSKAMELFEEMASSTRTSPDAITYFTLISGLSQAGRLNEACSIAALMQTEGLRPDVAIYNILISGFCKKGMLGRASETLIEMEKSGLKPDEVTFNTLVAALSKDGDFTAAHEVVSKMISEGFVPSVFTYGGLINGYCRASKLDEAMKLFREMPMIKISPNTVIYNILIDAHCKENEVNAALSLMDEMVVKGVLPSVATYNAIFKGFRERNMLEKVYELMDRMKEQGCNPDYITLEILTDFLSGTDGAARLRSFVQGFDVLSSSTVEEGS